MAKVPLTNGSFAEVDDDDIDVVSGHRWHAVNPPTSSTTYALARQGTRSILMHALILHVPDGYTVDHRDRNGLNNRRDNLRPATRSQQNQNKTITRNNTSGFRGVHRHYGKWRARIMIDGQNVHLGVRADAVSAARLYDSAARTHYGEYARLNFPDPNRNELGVHG